MEVIYRLGEATVAEVRAELSDPSSYSAIRTILAILEEKGHLRHNRRGRAYYYMPTVSPHKARRSVLGHLVRTFFNGSVENTVAALMSLSESQLSDKELARLEELIRDRRNAEKKR